MIHYEKDKYEDNKIYRAIFNNGKVVIINLANQSEYIEYKGTDIEFKNIQIQTRDEKEGSTLVAQALKTLTLLGLIYFFGVANAAAINVALSFSEKIHILDLANNFIKLNADGSVNHMATYNAVLSYIIDTNPSIQLPSFKEDASDSLSLKTLSVENENEEYWVIEPLLVSDELINSLDYILSMTALNNITQIMHEVLDELDDDVKTYLFRVDEVESKVNLPDYFLKAKEILIKNCIEAYELTKKADFVLKKIKDDSRIETAVNNYFIYHSNFFSLNKNNIIDDVKSTVTKVKDYLENVIARGYKNIYLFSTEVEVISKDNGEVEYISGILKDKNNLNAVDTKKFFDTGIASTGLIRTPIHLEVEYQILFFVDKMIASHIPLANVAETMIHEVTHAIRKSEDIIYIPYGIDGHLPNVHTCIKHIHNSLNRIYAYGENIEKNIAKNISNELYTYMLELFATKNIPLTSRNIKKLISNPNFKHALITKNADSLTLHIRELAKIFDKLGLTF